ncbi:hypothetical protein DEMA109039_15240 [Deinococcus marmoris]
MRKASAIKSGPATVKGLLFRSGFPGPSEMASFTTSQTLILSPKCLTTVVMYCVMAARMAAFSLISYTQAGALSCQTRVWPRTVWPFFCAEATIASAVANR